MSNPSRLQQRSPFRAVVRVRRNYTVLPPITQNIQPIEITHESIQSPVSIESVSVLCETPIGDPRDFWIHLHQHLAHEPRTDERNHGHQRTPNKVVRIFVSSTFTDFFNEREVLIKKVFPALRDQMEPLGIQIIDCDLRWGVPKDSTTEQTILTCLEELDRCLDDNGQPFFIGLISDKYGWVPKKSSLPAQITERYRWIDGASITLMEFIHGALRTANPNALFLMRNSENILKHLPDRYVEKFRDREEFNQRQIEELKVELPKIFPEEQIVHYDCFYNGLDASTGRERVKLDGLDEFEHQVKHFLLQAIEKWYPDQCQSNEKFVSEHQQMINFLVNKTQCFVDRPHEFGQLLKYIAGDHRDLSLFEGANPVEGEGKPLMALRGQSGDGKTMLLAKLAMHIEENMKGKYLFFYYFLDGAFHQNASQVMVTNLAQELHKYLNENNIVSPKTGAPLQITGESFFAEAIALIPIPVVIIVDGLDKGDLHQRRNYYNEFPFSNLTDLFSDHTYILVSCESNARLHETIRMRSHFELELPPFTVDQRRLYIETFFGRFNKTLESEQKELLLSNKGGEYPLYLSCICENLRQFGDYSLVTERLKTYPRTIDELMNFLMDEIYATVENRSILDAFCKLLVISEVGILESDIVDMLHQYLNKSTEEKDPVVVNPMVWSTLRRYIKTFLDTTWIYGHQLIIFRHSTIEQQIRKRLFKDDEPNEQRALHGFLANFFLHHASLKQFAVHRVPFHYEKAQMSKELVNFLRSGESRGVTFEDRRGYLNRIRCPAKLFAQDGILNQRAYMCNICAMQFKLGPFTVSKSTCLVCTNMIIGGAQGQDGAFKREARICQKHGTMGYPASVQCIVCKSIRFKQMGPTPSVTDPVPINICFQCWMLGGSGPRCCGFLLE